MERITPVRLRAIGQSLQRLDPQTGTALEAHAEWLASAEQALREANIRLAAPTLTPASVLAVRDTIDAVLGIVPRPIPISQSDEE